MNSNLNFSSIRALIIDIDGTLWRGNRPLPGLVRLFDFLYRQRLAFTIVTNNTVETPAQFQQKLASFGVTVSSERILTAAVATADYLTRKFKAGASIYMIGEAGLDQAMREAGFTLLTDASQPAEAVVIGGGSALTYNKLKDAILLLQRGACFFGTNSDLLVPTEEGLVPEAGTTLAAIQAATGLSPTIVGKPERLLFDIAIEKMGSIPGQTVMLGDRLDTDILGGQQAGLKTMLVTTGIDNEATISQKGIRPDAVFSGLDEMVELWQSQLVEQAISPLNWSKG